MQKNDNNDESVLDKVSNTVGIVAAVAGVASAVITLINKISGKEE